MHKGLYINTADFSLDQAKTEKQVLRLLANGDGVEVMNQEIDENITFDIYPLEDSTLMEFFYIIEGKIEYLSNEGENIELSVGDSFYTKDIQEPCVFKTLTKTKLLYISTQPVFHYIGESLKELHKISYEIDMKDHYTHGHSERVRDYAIKTALEMRLNRDKIAALAIASLFHDVGKIYIDDEILKKPSALSSNEYELIKKHPGDSAKHVRNIKYIDVAHIVEQHHERIDGSGYPKGLRNEEICIEAKIIGVVDSFDAMTSVRPYKGAKSKEEAIKEIQSLSGVIYDPVVVNAFIQSLIKDKVIEKKNDFM